MKTKPTTIIDWSKAPEGTTHYDTKFNYFCSKNGFYREGNFIASSNQTGWGTARYIPRPAEQPTWNGEGFPPVGCMVKVHNHEGYEVVYGHDVIGKEVKLLGIVTRSTGTKVAVVEYEEAAYCFRLSCIFPIKSERDQQIDALLSIFQTLPYFVFSRDMAADLYDKGVRVEK